MPLYKGEGAFSDCNNYRSIAVSPPFARLLMSIINQRLINFAAMKIDCHAHIMPAKWPDLKYKFGYGGFIHLVHDEKTKTADMMRDDGKFFRKVEENCYSLCNIEIRVIQFKNRLVCLCLPVHTEWELQSRVQTFYFHKS